LVNCVLQDYWIRILEVYCNFKYWTRYDELLIMMEVTEKWDISIIRCRASCQ